MVNIKKGNKKLKKKILSVFSKASQLNGFKKITNDNQISNLYNHNKKIWVAAYDQIRMLPEINDIIDKNLIKTISKKAKIKFPAFTSRPVIRVCMPKDRGTSRLSSILIILRTEDQVMLLLFGYLYKIRMKKMER